MPVVTDLKVAFLCNESFSPVTWDSLFVPNGLEQFSPVGLQHFSTNGVYAWGFSTHHSFDGVFDFGFCVDGEVLWRWWGVGGFIWLGVVRDFTEVLNPSIGLFTFSCNSAAIFAFHGGRVISIITTVVW